MDEKYYYGPVEQEILDLSSEAFPITTEAMVGAMESTSPQVVRNALSSLVEKGRLYRVQRGIYLRCDVPHKPTIEDPEALGLAIYKGYIGFATALDHWGLIEYHAFTIFIVTHSRSAERGLGLYVFRAISMGKKAQGMVFDRGVYVSTLEKTIFDCIYKPEHVGGYPLVAQAISESKPDWNAVVEWFILLGSPSLRNRAAYVIERAGNAPNWVVDSLRVELKDFIWLDPSLRRRGRLDKKLMIIDNVGGWDND